MFRALYKSDHGEASLDPAATERQSAFPPPRGSPGGRGMRGPDLSGRDRTDYVAALCDSRRKRCAG